MQVVAAVEEALAVPWKGGIELSIEAKWHRRAITIQTALPAMHKRQSDPDRKTAKRKEARRAERLASLQKPLRTAHQGLEQHLEYPKDEETCHAPYRGKQLRDAQARRAACVARNATSSRSATTRLESHRALLR